MRGKGLLLLISLFQTASQGVPEQGHVPLVTVSEYAWASMSVFN
jgi:hypothetical protein